MDFSETDTSDDEYALQKKALDVKLPENFDPNSIPTSGEEYLQHVIYERTKKCKKWVTAERDFTKFSKNQTILIKKDNEVQKGLKKFCPSKEWQDNAIKDFHQLRNLIRNTNECDGQKQFIKFDSFLEIIERSPPKYSEITKYCQAGKIEMLKEITKYLGSGSEVSECLGTWIYAILALLEKPLTPDCCFKLRELAKTCAKIRAQFDHNVNEEAARPFNLFICIISRYFNQLDLADD